MKVLFEDTLLPIYEIQIFMQQRFNHMISSFLFSVFLKKRVEKSILISKAGTWDREEINTIQFIAFLKAVAQVN